MKVKHILVGAEIKMNGVQGIMVDCSPAVVEKQAIMLVTLKAKDGGTHVFPVEADDEATVIAGPPRKER